MKDYQHPLATYPEDQKIDYLCLIASIASADGTVSNDEITTIRQFCQSIAISDLGIGVIMSTIEEPSMLDAQTTLTRLARTDLKFTLLADLLCMAYADGLVSPAEKEEISNIAAKLEITPPQITAIADYLQELLSRQRSEAGQTLGKQISNETVESLRSVGVPLSAITFSESLERLTTKDLTTTTSPGGMEQGIGVAVSLGLGSYFGVRWLFNKLRMKDDKE